MDFVFKFVVAKFKDYVLRNWETTVAGVLGSFLSVYVADPEAKQAILAGTVALVGLLAKAATKTGTVAQPREPEVAVVQAPVISLQNPTPGE